MLATGIAGYMYPREALGLPVSIARSSSVYIPETILISSVLDDTSGLAAVIRLLLG